MIVVLTMAGRGQRFEHSGSSLPKPFIQIAGKPMVEWAFRSLERIPYSKAIFVTLVEHARAHHVGDLARSLAGTRAEVIELPETTEGQLSSVLAAADWFRAGEDVLVAGADTYVQSGLAGDIAYRNTACRGLISVARLPGDRWSFAAVDAHGRVTSVAEKRRISDLAATGLYYFSDSQEFLETARAMIAGHAKTLGEFYVMPVYQRYLQAGKWIGVSEASRVVDMGTPDAARQAAEAFAAD